jgi:plastocyanin
MKISVRKIALGVLLVGAFVLAACGGAKDGAASGGLTVGTDGENLAFAPVTLTAKAGEKVSITFKNNSTALSHNFVLVNGGEDVAATVDEAAGTAGEAAGYIPADKANIIANSALIAPGASATVEFTAPAAGTYTYVCTYPAHLGGGMKGVLTVN